MQNISALEDDFYENVDEESLCTLTDELSANHPRSLSPSPASVKGKIARAAIQNASALSIDSFSVSSNDTGPISLDPNNKPSQYATSLLKAYRNHLKSMLSDHEEFKESPVIRSSVTSMKYCNSVFGLYGYYFGEVDTHSIPDGLGILCNHDGKLLDGKWRRGEFVGKSSIPSKNVDFNYSSSTCDTSTCSSLSASVTCNFVRSPSPIKHVDPKVPKTIHVPGRKSVHWPDTQFYFKQNTTQRKFEP